MRYFYRIHSYRHLTLWIILHQDFPVLGVSLHLVPIILVLVARIFLRIIFLQFQLHFILLILLEAEIILATTRVPRIFRFPIQFLRIPILHVPLRRIFIFLAILLRLLKLRTTIFVCNLGGDSIPAFLGQLRWIPR